MSLPSDPLWIIVLSIIFVILYSICDLIFGYFLNRKMDNRIDALEKRVNQDHHLVLDQNQTEVLVALLVLVHYDDLAKSFLSELPKKVQEMVHHSSRQFDND